MVKTELHSMMKTHLHNQWHKFICIYNGQTSVAFTMTRTHILHSLDKAQLHSQWSKLNCLHNGQNFIAFTMDKNQLHS